MKNNNEKDKNIRIKLRRMKYEKLINSLTNLMEHRIKRTWRSLKGEKYPNFKLFQIISI